MSLNKPIPREQPCQQTCRLRLHGLRISGTRNSMEAGDKQSWFLARLILLTWRCRRHVPPKHLLTFNGLHAVISSYHHCEDIKSYTYVLFFHDSSEYLPLIGRYQAYNSYSVIDGRAVSCNSRYYWWIWKKNGEEGIESNVFTVVLCRGRV
jgi:hypothetical protein